MGVKKEKLPVTFEDLASIEKAAAELKNEFSAKKSQSEIKFSEQSPIKKSKAELQTRKINYEDVSLGVNSSIQDDLEARRRIFEAKWAEEILKKISSTKKFPQQKLLTHELELEFGEVEKTRSLNSQTNTGFNNQ